MRKIYVTFQRKGIHLYPQAKDAPELQDVAYLGYPHRHLFKFKVTIEVFHDDREIEFHQFLNYLEGLYDAGTIELNHKSCEMIAEELRLQVWRKFPGRALSIEVSEDGECGAIIEWTAEENAVVWN